MKKTSVAFLASGLAITVAGCLNTPPVLYPPPPEPLSPVVYAPIVRVPVYIYAYPQGGCWADGLYYASCQWQPGPAYGYYVSYGGVYMYRPGVIWPYSPGCPPPMQWLPNPAYGMPPYSGYPYGRPY